MDYEKEYEVLENFFDYVRGSYGAVIAIMILNDYLDSLPELPEGLTYPEGIPEEEKENKENKKKAGEDFEKIEAHVKFKVSLRELIEATILGDGVDDSLQFLSEIEETKNKVGWLVYDTTALLTNQSNVSQGDLASALSCSQSKISQYIKSANTFPPELRAYDISLTVYDAAKDVNDSGLDPIDVLDFAMTEELSPRQVRGYIESHRPERPTKLDLKGTGEVKWDGHSIEIVPEVNYDESVFTEFNEMEVKFNIKEK